MNSKSFSKIKKLAQDFRINLEPRLIEKHAGKYALVLNEGLKHIFDSSFDAEIFARSQNYETGSYCIQEIGAEASNYGFMTHMVS